MTDCFFYLDPAQIPQSPSSDELHVLLYGGSAPVRGSAAIGKQVFDLFHRFGVQPSTRAVDLLSIALAVTAADRFVLRSESDTNWSRDIRIHLPLAWPDPWNKVIDRLAATLNFLSGDVWSFELERGGLEPPLKQEINSFKRTIDLQKGDCVALFSGGLDSTIHAIHALQKGMRPILVSHGSRGDQEIQNLVASRLPTPLQHLSVNTWTTSDRTSEDSMRARSFLFIALATLVCDLKYKFSGTTTRLIVPENGLIALNAPLTPRRTGSQSTRTTHPYYFELLQTVFDELQLRAEIVNPYETQTKGEMAASLQMDDLFNDLASQTISCGKWKRSGKQCGRCVPCLIRRAALYAGNIDDQTDYISDDLSVVLDNEGHRDDLIAMMSGVSRLGSLHLARWVSRAGPLPKNETRRVALLDVHKRGLLEVGQFLKDSGLEL
mmetsp:Transcript_23643/g.41986  ORF Transcript_23643/g.41986 Transcript_23643/m.41986 type:complete len:436 (-) Transcript_23643:3469-4776(-)